MTETGDAIKDNYIPTRKQDRPQPVNLRPVEQKLGRNSELNRVFSIVITSLKEIDSIVANQVYESMFLG